VSVSGCAEGEFFLDFAADWGRTGGADQNASLWLNLPALCGSWHMADVNQHSKVVIAGGSGFLGVSLATHLASTGASVVILSRHAPKVAGAWRHVHWDARTPGDWCGELNGAAGLVNLAGRSVDCIKTPDRQDEIVRSRVEATHVLGRAVRALEAPPPVWVQMSTGHIYGDPPEAICTEQSCTGAGFAPFVGRAWEEAFYQSALDGQRKVVFRTSFVIGRDRGAGGGALARLKRLVRFGLGGRAGRGTQGISWIHETDLNRLFERALFDTSMHGVYLATAPNPVSQCVFMRELRRAMRMPIALPAFAWMVRLGAPLLMRTDPELALYGRYLISQRLRDDGFEFKFADVHDALAELSNHGADPLPGHHLRHGANPAVATI
jgi:uncharacterized protein (TIGR01777 family)